jgi:aryl-alcohol dehydrogenase-like predicted oxidoreductase
MKRKLGDREVLGMGLGCMSFGGIYGATDEDESLACLAAAQEAGVDHLDVAEIYGMGRSEEIIGRFLRETGAEMHIATKAGIYPKPERHFRNDEAALRASLEGSLQRLGRDSVELFYIHRREAERPVEEVAETMARFIDEGLIGSWGLSEVAPSTIRRAHAVCPVAAVQSEYSLWTRQPELGVLQTCAELGIAFVAFSPVGRGIFADRFPEAADFPKEDFRIGNPRFTEPNYAANRAAIAGFQDFCRSKGWSTAAAAIAWTLDRGEHVLPIPGTRSAAHLHECLTALEIRFTDEDRAEIARLLPVGFAHGDRYADAQIYGVERYC